MVMLWLMALTVAGCAVLVGRLPPADLTEPGWSVHEGQAVWRMAQGGPEIAGEVMVATRADGRAFVQFSKAPFQIVVAQASTNRWQAEFPSQHKHYAGRGKPPRRLIWLYLPRVLAGEPAPEGWTWHLDSGQWRLENGKTGEAVEGYFGRMKDEG